MTQAMENATAYNESLYEDLWARMPFLLPNRLPWWPAFKELADKSPSRLELGPGVFPRFPVEGTHVCDLSKVALDVLTKHGAIAHHGLVQDHKFPDGTFDSLWVSSRSSSTSPTTRAFCASSPASPSPGGTWR